MKRKIMSLLLVSCLVLALFPIHAGAAAPVNVTINGVPVQFNDSTGYPFIDSNGRTQVPLRAAMEAMGADVGWNNYERAASVVRGGTCVIVPVGSNRVYVNGEEYTNDTTAQIKGGRTYLPIRIVAESLGAEVDWLNTTRTVAIQVGAEVEYNNWPLFAFIGYPINTAYYAFGYNCTEGWCGPSNSPSLIYEKSGVWFNLEMDAPHIDLDNPATLHHPENQIFTVTSASDYPILGTALGPMCGQMTVTEINALLTDDFVELIYDDGTESEYGEHYWVMTHWYDNDNGNQYDVRHIWEGTTYPGSYTKSSYAVLWKN